MFEDINFKKIFLFLALLVGLGIYVHTHYSLKDVLAYSRSHPHEKLSPRIDYYVGMLHYVRSEYIESTAAFEQLLADYPTSQYAPYALYRLSSSYAQRSQWESTRQAYQRYLKEFPDGPHAGLVKNKYEVIKFR